VSRAQPYTAFEQHEVSTVENATARPSGANATSSSEPIAEASRPTVCSVQPDRLTSVTAADVSVTFEVEAGVVALVPRGAVSRSPLVPPQPASEADTANSKTSRFLIPPHYLRNTGGASLHEVFTTRAGPLHVSGRSLTNVNRLLVIEDDPTIAGAIADRFRSEGFTVAVEDDGLRGLQAAKREPPDLVILDVMLPGLDGVEVPAMRKRTF
jgi:CheY-like chemotaxis protein